MAHVRRIGIAAATLVALLALDARGIAGTPIAEPALRAAFLYNFAKFTTWPADALPPGAPMTVCIVGDGAVAGTLTQIIGGRAVDGRDVRVSSAVRDAALERCQVVYIAGTDGAALMESFNALKHSPVLTVADGRSAVRTGAVASLFVDGDRMRFSVNVDAMQRARIHISSKVLMLALVVRDEADGSH